MQSISTKKWVFHLLNHESGGMVGGGGEMTCPFFCFLLNLYIELCFEINLWYKLYCPKLTGET